MSKYSCDDNYSYPDSDVLKNKFDIREQSKLDRLEEEFVSLRSFELSEKPVALPYSIKTLQYIHKKLFEDIYEWAGEFRTIDLTKGTSRFANITHIEKSLDKIFKDLSEDNFLQDLSKNDFAKKAAYYMGEINAVHPFREGNGRAQREFINQLAYNAGYYISWNKISPKNILDATIDSFKSDCLALEKLILKNLEDLEDLKE